MKTMTISTEIEIIKRKQKGILELKSTISEIKNLVDGLNSRFVRVEERISKIGDKTN